MERRYGCCGARRGTTVIRSSCALRLANAIIPWVVVTTAASVVCWWFLVASVFPPSYFFPWSAWLTWRAVGSAAGGEIFLCKNKILLRAGGFVPPVEQEWFDGRKSPGFRVLRGASWNNNDPLKLRSSVRVEPPTHPRRFP